MCQLYALFIENEVERKQNKSRSSHLVGIKEFLMETIKERHIKMRQKGHSFSKTS